jgi:anti-anti-sigma factor
MPVQQATFSIEALDGAALLSISGEVDISNKEQLELALHEGFAQDSPTFIANLLDLTYADSTCIHALLHAQQTAERTNKSLILVIQEDGELQKIFQIAGLVKVFDIRHSLAGALAEKASRDQ